MSKFAAVATSDISWGYGTFERTSRLDPNSNITVHKVNAEHIPTSSAYYNASTVNGFFQELATSAPAIVASGLAQTSSIGAAISGIISSGIRSISGVVLSNYIENRDNKLGVGGVTGSGWRMDAGVTGFSGWIQHAISTAISTINYMNLTPVAISGGYYDTGAYSGQAQIVSYLASGHAFNIYKHYPLSGAVTTSAGTSSQVAWMAVGI